ASQAPIRLLFWNDAPSQQPSPAVPSRPGRIPEKYAMSSPPEQVVQPQEKKGATAAERRADIDANQAQVAALLAEVDCEALFIFEPENFSWFTSGATPRSILDPHQLPGLFVAPEIRALMASNVDAQRLFDEELDGLGFQLKEWPWQAGREQLMSYLA